MITVDSFHYESFLNEDVIQRILLEIIHEIQVSKTVHCRFLKSQNHIRVILIELIHYKIGKLVFLFDIDNNYEYFLNFWKIFYFKKWIR